uniref:Reverse transcriptase domain-containing protein n=1 Tax=Tanacetum cinerariifolium TaxID=118510 RepID=A0A699HIG5_TANCI|nr:reverse transcriptase domain-containing protein [Tanacetum cinerariifolium]
MSTNEQTPLSQPTSAVRNTLGKKQDPQGLGRPTSNTALREYCDRNYHPLLPIIAEKVHQEKMQQERLEAVKARLNFEETSQHFESGTPNRRRDLKESSETRGRVRPHTRTIQGVDHTTVAAETLKVATRVIAQKKQSLLSKDIIKKSILTKDESAVEKQPLRPNAGRCQRGVTCSISLTGNTRVWFDDLLKESIDSYDDLKEAFLENYLQQKKCIKDPVKIHNIKQRDGESMEDFVRRYKLECRDVKGAPKCMKIFGFMHGITNSELIKRLHDKIPKSVDEMMRGEDGTEGPMIIEDEIGGHFVHRMYVDGGSSSEILYEHCFNRFRPEVRSQMIPAATPLVGFSGEIIWPLGQISKAESKENPGSSVHSSRNAKISSGKRNGHIAE